MSRFLKLDNRSDIFRAGWERPTPTPGECVFTLDRCRPSRALNEGFTMTNALWELNKMEGKNPTHTGGFLTAYDQREFTPEEVAARESGQNAGDAGRDVEGVTKLDYRTLTLTGAGKDRFIEAFEFRSLFEGRLEQMESEPKNQLLGSNIRQFLETDSIQLLLISDYNTCGLGGAWDEYEPGVDHFGRLVCALNLDDKADIDDKSAGSFGLGKTTYAKSSAINTVIYHSVFKPDERTRGAQRRLMASGVYPRHNFQGHRYGGFAYFGAAVEEAAAVAKPFENEDAANWWSLISECVGVDLTRPDHVTGTDILIIMPTLDLARVREATEEYYFPAIIDAKLAVRFIDENNEIHLPKIYDRPALAQFIRLYRDAKNDKVEKSESKEVAHLNKFKDHKIGTIAFEAASDTSSNDRRTNCVAIYRDTGMVINYLKVGSEAYEPAVGVFLADQDTHKYLVLAENAAHSEWSEHMRKLEDRYPSIGREIVAKVNSNFRTRFSQFQKNLQPDIVTSKTETGLLSRLLSSALAGSKGEDGPSKDFNNPVALHLTRKERRGDHSVWHLRIHDNEYTPDVPFPLALHPSISLAGDSKLISIKHMDFSIKDPAGKVIAKGDRPQLNLNFERGMVLDYHIEIPNPGRHNFIVRCKCVTDKEVISA
jgi:hypothetical protein